MSTRIHVRALNGRTLSAPVAFLLIVAVVCNICGSCGTSDPTNVTPVYTQSPSLNGTNTGTGGNGGNNNQGSTELNIRSNDHVMGSSNARVTVIEYADFQCPCCGKFAREDFPSLKANYIDTGKIRYIYRHFPLTNIHNRAKPAAEASECAADEVEFYDMFELIFGTTDSSGQANLSDSQLQQNATSLGAEAAAYNSCLSSHAKASRVQVDMDSGTALELTGTPTFFIDTERFPPAGSPFCPDYASISAVIDQHLGG